MRRREQTRWIFDQVHLQRDQRVLLLGCGSGADLSMCFARGVSQIVAAERSLLKLLLACHLHRGPRLLGRLDLRWGDFQLVTCEGAPFDRVVARISAPPSTEFRILLRNIRCKIKVGGVISVAVNCGTVWQNATAAGEDLRLALIGSGWVGTNVEQRLFQGECVALVTGHSI